MITGFKNALLNPDFSFWDYGVGPFTVSGYTASRWKMALTGAPTVSVSQGTNGATTATPKWLRGRPNLSVNVTGYTAGADTITITQRIEAGERFGQQNLILSGVASGPAGAHFYVTINGNAHKVSTEGDSGGVPILTHFVFSQVIDDPSTEYIPVDIFTRPSATGLYRLHFAQQEFSEVASEPSPFEIRAKATERMLLNRYVYPIPVGLSGIASSTSNFAAPVPFPVEMRTAPTFKGLLTANVNVNLLSSGGAQTAASPTYSSSTHAQGARLVILGYAAALTAGSQYYLGTAGVGVYDADY